VPDSLDLNEIAKCPSRYWNRDGLVEVFVGLMMPVPAVLFGLAGELPKADSDDGSGERVSPICDISL
jgi:hypothetical protein